MSHTFSSAKDQVLGVFHTLWDGLGYPAHYEDVPASGVVFPPPDTTTPWARVIFRDVTGTQATLGSPRLYDRNSLLTLQLFTPSGTGGVLALSLAQQVADAYQTASPTGGLFYRDIRPNQIGPSGAWYQINLFVGVSYCQLVGA